MSGPQLDVPVGSDLHSQGAGWSGLTIKEILEKVDLFNITVEDDADKVKSEKVLVGRPPKATKGSGTVINTADPEAAFLGPKIWDKPISMQPFMDDTEFSIMNIDDFLNENNISLDDEDKDDEPMTTDEHSQGAGSSSSPEPAMRQEMPSTSKKSNNLPKNGFFYDNGFGTFQNAPNDFLYAESKRAKAEREKAERKRKLESEVEFAPEDLALATIPGASFDPRKRAFSTEELKPQPIIRKRKKHFVPQDAKDERYWEKRIKNNMAARRSREARRLKENQIALRAAFLEKENQTLKMKLDEAKAEAEKLKAEKLTLQDRLSRYEIA